MPSRRAVPAPRHRAPEACRPGAALSWPPNAAPDAGAGFTLIQLMVTIAIVAILLSIATPSMIAQMTRAQIQDGMKLAEFVKGAVGAYYLGNAAMPADNAAAGLPDKTKIVGTVVAAVEVRSGAVNILFGNKAAGTIAGKVLTLRPAYVADAPMVPVSWVCGPRGTAPNGMTLAGDDQTTLDLAQLPFSCR